MHCSHLAEPVLKPFAEELQEVSEFQQLEVMNRILISWEAIRHSTWNALQMSLEQRSNHILVFSC